MKKIILGGLIIGSCIAGITQATNIITGGREFLQLSNGEEGYFTENKITKAETNQFDITSNGGGNRTYTFNGNNYNNVFKILITNRQVPSYIRLWNENSELVYASSYLGKGYTPTKVCKIEDGDYTKINQDNCYTTDITELYTEETNLEYLTFGQQINQTVDSISVRDKNAICFKFVNGITYCARCGIGQNGCQGGQTQIFNNNGSYEIQDYANIAGISPFSAGGAGEITPIIYTGTITNQHAIYAYEQLGLTANQCYGGYPIDKLYNTGDVLYQGYQAGTGATIIDLYNTNSGNYQGYNSTYMTIEQTKITQFLSENYEGYQTNGLQFFIGKQEALITIIQQYNNGNQQAINKGKEGYSLFQLYTYCDLLINNNNENIYTGNTATPDMRRNGINNENHDVITPQTGTVFDQLQDEEGNYTRNKAQDIRDTINRVYSKLTTIFKFRSGVEGIIPQEIIRILLIIILFKIFKK